LITGNSPGELVAPIKLILTGVDHPVIHLW
jgi:hypothetical protein